ncbi:MULTISPECIES: metalloregulator ArsR/SmtB family transcription factor [Mycobacteriales]|uniref:Metalloregulator ArsR/SmtB family transcription factor n=1 Tax=Gordonia rubripertincta TaxID=36822 RepID=A0ABT4MXW8_GORRU|nr:MULTISPECIES: metalloregulator ArsR/SmtB family transcription factor [Mycobacteriales]MBA4023288.1 ArsR family transcriptional regulator [Gordonia sp. (in: high G+C Gram-positive bacteria)]MCZ4551545.1 metalloregulator ArsR/SmtB family transcription factor [Gordonia rubripertincta]ORM26864.1 transcriptional regulator [Williamsia sp. 1135]OZG26335.1 transcriptional regulator [Williamsia sp. 1138]
MAGHQHTEIDGWANRFALLSDSTRLSLLTHMHEHPGATVSELADAASITENAASQSLRALRAQGWVTTTKSGRTVHYRIVPDAIVHRILHDIMGAEHAEHSAHEH